MQQISVPVRFAFGCAMTAVLATTVPGESVKVDVGTRTGAFLSPGTALSGRRSRDGAARSLDGTYHLRSVMGKPVPAVVDALQAVIVSGWITFKTNGTYTADIVLRGIGDTKSDAMPPAHGRYEVKGSTLRTYRIDKDGKEDAPEEATISGGTIRWTQGKVGTPEWLVLVFTK
ncbi:MAG: hypothetical protein NVS1B4_19940 [Gemmatimonadaceae bacterium]